MNIEKTSTGCHISNLDVFIGLSKEATHTVNFNLVEEMIKGIHETYSLYKHLSGRGFTGDLLNATFRLIEKNNDVFSMNIGIDVVGKIVIITTNNGYINLEGVTPDGKKWISDLISIHDLPKYTTAIDVERLMASYEKLHRNQPNPISQASSSIEKPELPDKKESSIAHLFEEPKIDDELLQISQAARF